MLLIISSSHVVLINSFMKIFDTVLELLSREDHITKSMLQFQTDFKLKKVLLPPLGNFADISYLEENFKPHLLRDVCTLCSGALVSDSLLHMLL